MRRHKRKYIPSRLIIVVLLLVFGMGIGYAAISTTLTIDGTSDIDSASWDVHFNNIQVTSGSVSATTPAISNNTSVSFSANLANPGDFYEFTVDVVNAGTLDAKLDAITVLPVLTQAQQNYFKYTVSYTDGSDIDINDSLAAGITETLIIRCEYLVQSDTSLYPTEDTTLNFSVSMTYVQGHGYTRSIVYTTSSIQLQIGESIPNNVTTYDNYTQAEQEIGKLMFIKHILKNNIIVASYVGGGDEDIYYIRGAGATQNGNTYNNDSPYFADNINYLNQLFLGNCTSATNSYSCTGAGGAPANSTITAQGEVYINISPYRCWIGSNGSSRCYQP